MIKRIIFDLDNTLIDWKDEYDEKILSECYKKENIEPTISLIKKTSTAIGNYEKKYNTYKKEFLLNHINKITRQHLPISFIDNYFENSIKFSIPDKLPKEEIHALKYLSSKYELVILTNWFTYPQVERLKKLDIYKYFSYIYSAENFKSKPNKESFITAMGNNTIDECCMIGDDYKTDILGALNIGLSAVYLNKNNKKEIKNCIRINNFEDLCSIF